MTCSKAPSSTASGNHLGDSITMITNPGSLSATCSGASKLSGVVYASSPLTQHKFTSYALLSSSSSHASLSASDAASAFVSSPAQWLGSSSTSVTGVSGTSTMYLVGDASNPTGSSVPVLERYFAPVVLAGGSTTTDLTSSSGTTFYCALPDQSAFAATFIAANATITEGGVPTSCFSYDSVDTLHAACTADSACIGFSTVRVNQRELSLCLHVSGTNTQPSTYPYDRIFYSKPPASTISQSCAVTVERSGRIAVYLQQTSFGSGGAQAVVRIAGTVAAVCGGSQPFSNGFAGKSGRCQLFALCYAGSVPLGASVAITLQGAIAQNGCNNSLGVLVSQTSVDTTQVAATTMAPIERVTLEGATGRVVHLAAGTTQSIRTLPLFVYGASSVAMEVTQTGFDCSLGGCGAYSVTMRTAGTCQRCGGNAGFFRSNRAGLSDQCDTGFFCGSSMSLRAGTSDVTSCETPGATSSSTPYTGHVRVAVDPSTLRFRTSLCTGFTATLFAAPMSSPSSSYVPVYPLLDNITGFRTLLTAPSALSATDAATYVSTRSGVPVSALAPLFNLGPFGSQITAFYAPSLGASPQTTLHVNSTLACVVDHSAGSSAKCVFPVPRGTIKVRVLVAQNDFALDANQLSVSLLSGSSVRTSLQCGGSQRFGLDVGAQELCSDYRVCTDRYLYTDDADAETATDGYVTVEVPSHIRSRTCNFTASIIVEFTRPFELTPYSCATYECPGERKCLPYSSVCDSVQDCSSNSDEEWCTPWRALDSGSAFCVPTEFMTNYTSKTYTDCRRLAAINTTSVFTLIGTTCVVYSSSISATILASPTEYVCGVEGAMAHVRLPIGATFSLCTSSIECNGNGAATSNTSAGACTCTCISGYTGATCTERMSLSNIKTIIVALQTPSNRSLDVNLATLGNVLKLNYSAISVVCDAVLPSPLDAAAQVFVECTVASDDEVPAVVYVHQRRLLVPTAWAAATASLATLGVPGIDFITARTTMQPVLPIYECSGSSCSSNRPFTAIRVISLAATALESATLTITDSTTSSSSTSSSRTARRVVSCTPASTDVGGGCVSSACDLELTGTANSNVTVSSTTFATATTITGTCTAVGVSLQTHEMYGNIATLTNDTVMNVESNYNGFLAGAVVLFVCGWLISIVLVIVMWRKHRMHMNAFTDLIENKESLSPIAHLKALLLGRIAYVHHCSKSRSIRFDRVALVFGSFAILCAVAASALTLYYVTAYARDSNFSVMYEEYTDSMCVNSPSASMPRRVFGIPRASSECTRMSITGETAGVVYADGHCEGSDGSYSAVIRSSGTFLTCMNAATTTVSSGSCLHISSINPSDTRSIYVQLSCSTDQQISERTTTLSKLTTAADIFISSELSTLNSELLFASRPDGPPTTTIPSSLGGDSSTPVYQFPYLSNNVIKSSSSFTKMTVSSTASSELFDDVYDSSRVVLQRFPDSFYTSSTSSSADVASSFTFEEDSVLPMMANLSSIDAISNMRPQDGDYGVGYMFGGFGTSSELTWQGAAPQAHRHYDIRGTNFDVAHHLPRAVEELAEGAGFSISMYLRASNTTKGFAFAVTDAFENTQSGTVYTLDRLAEIIENGQASSAWFASTYRVYASLFVSGPTRQLTFAHADPSEVDRVQLLDWDMDRIGAQYLFNGLWHHVAVVYRVENGKLRATLIVDGSTSYAAEGWSVCADRLPPTVGTFSNASLFDQSSDKVTDGGLLVVGYFNGGVYGLTSSPFELLNTDYLGTGTTAMREHNAFPRTSTLALGIVLIILGTAALIFVVIAACIDVRALMISSNLSESREAMQNFLTLQLVATTARTFFGHEVDPAFPLIPIRLSTALRWSKLGLNQFSTLPTELVNQARHPGEQLLLILYNAHTSSHLTEITPAMWNALVEKDEEEIASGRRCWCCLAHKSDAVQDAIMLGVTTTTTSSHPHRRKDMFTRIMKYRSTTTSKKKDDNNSDFSEDEDDEDENGEDDVEHIGEVEGLTKATELKDAGKNGGGGKANDPNNATEMSSSMGGIGGTSDSLIKSLTDVLAPVIVVFQSMYVWSNSIEFPSLYNDYFADIFSFVSIDVAMTFPGIPPIVTPLVQMFLGFIVIAVVIYFICEEHRQFENCLAQYVWRRDNFESTTTEGSMALYESLPMALTSMLADDAVSEPRVTLTMLPVPECRKLDAITGSIKSINNNNHKNTNDDSADDGNNNIKNNNTATTTTTATVKTLEGVEYTVTQDVHNKSHLLATPRAATSKKRSSTALLGSVANEIIDVEDDGVGVVSILKPVGCYCWRHPHVPLTAITQTDIYPFHHTTTCGCIVNGKLCGAEAGLMYTCGERYLNEETGRDVVCTFGLCKAHCRMSLKDNVIATIYGAKRQFLTNGIVWMITVVLIFAVNTIYTPFLKTALMILACHPLYQCEFEHCWTFITQEFALAAFLSGSVVLVLGIGFPALLLVQLFRRRAALNTAFFEAEYADKYVSPETKMKKKSWQKELCPAEWARFSAADSSALAAQYSQASYRWLMMPALVLVFKVLVLIPAVFLEPRSFELRLGCGLVEIGVAIFYFATNTQLSPILLMTIRAASVHQLLFLGSQNIDLVAQFDDGTSLSLLLIAITFIYIIFTLIVFIATVVYPLFIAHSDKRQAKKFLNSHGLDFSTDISLYMEPHGHHVEDAEEDDGMPPKVECGRGGDYSVVTRGGGGNYHDDDGNFDEEEDSVQPFPQFNNNNNNHTTADHSDAEEMVAFTSTPSPSSTRGATRRRSSVSALQKRTNSLFHARRRRSTVLAFVENNSDNYDDDENQSSETGHAVLIDHDTTTNNNNNNNNNSRRASTAISTTSSTGAAASLPPPPPSPQKAALH